MSIDINGVGRTNANIFGFDCSLEDAEIVIVPFSWDVSCSFGKGTRYAPGAILKASSQLDFYHPNTQNSFEGKVFMQKETPFIIEESKYLGVLAEDIYQSLESGLSLKEYQIDNLGRINERTTDWLTMKEQQISELLDTGKKVILLGGEHACTLAYIQALNKRKEDYGVLQIDAHMDLRSAYAGFKFSHASVMYNALELNNKTIVQIGVRDCAPIEIEHAKKKNVRTFFNLRIKERLFAGETWKNIVDEILSFLPSNVYLTLDIDGLNPLYCPNTGTPVPGGLSYDQCVYLIHRVAEEKNIIGADLMEVGSKPFDANVGSRILWEIINLN